ncbi:magnesium/cobalt transporter CorA [Bacteroidota bacterium]
MKASKFHSPIGPLSIKKILKKNQPQISQKVGLPPGTIIYTGQPKDGKTGISLLQYNESTVDFFESENFQEISGRLDKNTVNWINFDSLHEVDLISKVGTEFNVHNLTLEDIVNVDHQPKIEEYDNYLYLTLKMIKPNIEENSFNVEQISFVLYKNMLISFQEHKGDPFENIRERIKQGKGKARGRGSDYLLFLLIDAIIDQYLLSIEAVNKYIADLEIEIFEDPNERIVKKIIDQKRVLSELRRIIYPVRDGLKEITKGETEYISESYYNYFNDVYDHIKSIVDHLDSQREMLTSLMDFYMSQMSTQMNKVMQTLTIIATIFIPLTFLAGIYGMNFEFMPELAWKWSYPILLSTMTILGVSMYIYMRRKRWF